MSRRPATISAEIKIDMPRPREMAMMESEPFNGYVRELRRSIEASHAQ
jgi:ABC-type nitrate/sulfonate/bicarbonate transport system ATPase subunit